MRKQFLIALLISLSCAQYTLNLEKVTIPHTTAPAYNEDLHYVKIAFNKDNTQQKAVLDTSQTESWRIVPTSTGTVSITAAYKEQIKSLSAKEVNNEVELPKNKKIQLVQFNEGAVTTTSNVEYTKAERLGAGLALGIGEKSFLDRVTKSQKLQWNSFSFYFRTYKENKLNQVRFGSPQGYFAKESPVTFKVDQPANNEGKWKIRLTNMGFDQMIKAVNLNAIFDTTTEFIWVKQDQLDFIMQTLTNQYGLQFTNGDECACKSAKNPQIYFQFSNGASAPANENTKAKFYLTVEDFLKESATAGRCNLVFRLLVDAADNDVILGTAFLKGVYTWFYNPSEGNTGSDDGTKRVKMSTSFKVPLQNLKFDANWRVVLTTVGCFVIVCSVAILLSILQKVPYEATEFVAVQTYNPRPVVVNQSPIQQQPLVYSQSPFQQQSLVQGQSRIQYVQQSPQRVVYRN